MATPNDAAGTGSEEGYQINPDVHNLLTFVGEMERNPPQKPKELEQRLVDILLLLHRTDRRDLSAEQRRYIGKAVADYIHTHKISGPQHRLKFLDEMM